MATRNGERFLGAQLATIAVQTRLPDELVVVDDASTDGTVDMLSEYARSAPFPVRLHRNERHLGSNATFEAALEKATGDVLVLGDQDDEWVSTKLELTAERFKQDPELGMVFSDGWVIDEDGELLDGRLWSIHGFTHQARRVFRADPFAYLLPRAVASGCTMAFRASLLPLVTPVPDLWDPAGKAICHHDRWFSIAMSAISKVDFIDAPLIRYRVHPDQQVGAPDAGRALLHQLWQRRSVSSVAPWMRLYADYLGQLACHLEALPVRPAALAIESIRDHADHLRARSTLAPQRHSRWPVVCAEWRARGYHRYGHGLRSAAADLVRSA
jgi:hypothetical protein